MPELVSVDSVVLERCPFCGGVARWCADAEHECHLIVCDDCKISIDFQESPDAETVRDLQVIIAGKWNRRADADTKLLNSLEQAAGEGACPGIINDDNGHWAVSDSGIQNVPMDAEPCDIATTFFVKANQWKPTIREAIRAYLDEDDAVHSA